MRNSGNFWMCVVGAQRLKILELLTGSSDMVMQSGFCIGCILADEV